MDEIKKEIVFEAECDRCEAHKTELGVLLSITESVYKNFSTWSQENQMNLIISWFECYKRDEISKFIQAGKKETTAQIQKYKQANIKTINNSTQK